MSVSGSFDFTQNRSEIISNSFVEAGVLRPDETPDSDESVFAAVQLNMMLKAWQADGLHVFANRQATLFLERDKINYKLGATGDHATESFSTTAMRVAAVDTDTTMEVDSTTGMTAGDYIGVEIDDGTMHWDTVATVTDGDTVELTTGVDGAVAVDNVVYWYTTKIQRPLNVTNAYYRFNSSDSRMYRISKSDYMRLSDKNTETQPSQFYFDKQLTNTELNLYGEPNSVLGQVVMSLQFPFDDMDAATDNLAFPAEWLEAIHLGLAYRLARSYRSKDPKTLILKQDSEQAKYAVMGFDEERADLDLHPDSRWLQD